MLQWLKASEDIKTEALPIAMAEIWIDIKTELILRALIEP
jgi:hypothetical protein